MHGSTNPKQSSLELSVRSEGFVAECPVYTLSVCSEGLVADCPAYTLSVCSEGLWPTVLYTR